MEDKKMFCSTSNNPMTVDNQIYYEKANHTTLCNSYFVCLLNFGMRNYLEG